MTWKDKLELGLKKDAPFRKDNLPESQVRGPEIPAGPGRSPIIPAAIEDIENAPKPPAPTPAGDQAEEDRAGRQE
jgi:hypothetical protein